MRETEDELDRAGYSVDVRQSSDVLGVGGVAEEHSQSEGGEGVRAEEDPESSATVDIYPDTAPSDPVSDTRGVLYAPPAPAPEVIEVPPVLERVARFLVRHLGSGRVQA